MALTYSGYGDRPYLNTDARDRSYLTGIGQTYDRKTGISGSTASEAYDKYKATGATEAELAEFARRIRFG